mgnify:FL=1
MKLFNKTAIALTLSLLGAASSASAITMTTDNTLHEEIKIKVVDNKNDKMNVFVSVDGKITTVDASPSVMNNPEELRELLVDVPEDIRDKLIESLISKNIHHDNLEIDIGVEGDINQELHWLSKGENEVNHNIEATGENRVIVMKIDDSNSENRVVQKVVKQMLHTSVKPSNLRNLQIVHQGNMTAESIISMIRRTDFTADELNAIQQVLDVKR